MKSEDRLLKPISFLQREPKELTILRKRSRHTLKSIRISAAAQLNTQKYYPAADFVPGGVSNSLYKTTMLLMRKIMAKDVTWTMGSTVLETQRSGTAAAETPHQVTLTNNYYIGVYEITQSQWGTVYGNMPSYFTNATDRAMRPVENVKYNYMRNIDNATSYLWPSKPDPNSFLGKLRTKTGVDFELPSEAQWEFAARAGNGSTKWGDGSGVQNTDEDENLNRLGRYKFTGGYIGGTTEPDRSCVVTNGTAIVGSCEPNNWGLYDMAGNVWEMVLDFYAQDITTLDGKVNIDPSDPTKPLSGDNPRIVKKGGAWDTPSNNCRPAYRTMVAKSLDDKTNGFRVVCTAGLQ